jgi:hypothetical protein
VHVASDQIELGPGANSSSSASMKSSRSRSKIAMDASNSLESERWRVVSASLMHSVMFWPTRSIEEKMSLVLVRG